MVKISTRVRTDYGAVFQVQCVYFSFLQAEETL